MGKKVLILAKSGFGKSTSIGKQSEHENGLDIEIEGLDPYHTYVISATDKDLPFRGSRTMFPQTTYEKLVAGDVKGRRISTNNAYEAAKIILFLINVPPIHNIVIDDTNYFQQDYMMANSLKSGWDAPKKAAHMLGSIFDAIQAAGPTKNIYMMAHYESYKVNSAGDLEYRMKTTGQSADNNITPEGKFDIMFFGKQYIDIATKKQKKVFITNFDGEFNAKSAPGMFPLEIPNDLGYVARMIDKYYSGEEKLVVSDPEAKTGLVAPI